MINNNNALTTIHDYNIDIENREIFLHPPFDNIEESNLDYRSAVIFEKNLRHLNLLSLDPILVHMHLPGGDWEDCLSMYDAIKLSKAKVIILAYAKAESSSSVLLQAGDLRILMPNTNVLIHYGSFTLDGEHSKAAASSIQWNERECDKMIDIFTDRCINSNIYNQKNWKRMMAKKHIVSQLANKCDWILTAEEAVNYGFADGVLGTKKYPNIDYIKSLVKKQK
ncbi:MAG: ATP-dependent Clp protease proteolytic subunit [Minisyncoccia bacterium]